MKKWGNGEMGSMEKWGQPPFPHFPSAWPVSKPKNYLNWLNEVQVENKEEIIEKSIIKSNPFGDDNWVGKIVKKFRLEQTLRKIGRPKEAKNGG